MRAAEYQRRLTRETQVCRPRGSMTSWRIATSWRIMTSLFLILSLIDLSKEGCADHFKMDQWTGEELNRIFPLAQTKDPGDLIHCTMELACNRTRNPPDRLCNVLYNCFNTDEKKEMTCEGPSSRNISFYHLMCLAAKALPYPPDGVPPKGCDYENVCEHYPQISVDQTTTTAPITEPSPTTATSTVLSLTTTPAPPPTPGTTTVKHDEGNTNSRTGRMDASTLPYMCLLIISVFLNFVLPLAVFFCMRQRTRHRTQSLSQQDESSMLDKTCNDLDFHLTPVINKPNCLLIDSPSADTTRNRNTSGNGLESH